jgi:hypothetical protein
MADPNTPTLTLSIPLILLGRHAVHTPRSPTEPLILIAQTIQHYCPNISIVPWPLNTAIPQSWILWPAPHTNESFQNSDKYGWLKSDTRLTPSEASLLGSDTWSCGFVLQRTGIPAATATYEWKRFVSEAHELLAWLKRVFVDFKGPVERVENATVWDLVASETCVLRIEVDDPGAEAGSGAFELGRNVLMLAAAFERELDMLRSTQEVVQVMGVSRWLEGCLLRRLAKKRGRCYELGSVREDENERYKRTVGREREWWDVVREMDESEISGAMQRIKDHGLRLGVSLGTDEDGNHRIVVQGQRSTLDTDYLVAYTELLACIINTAHRHGANQLVEALEDFQLLQASSHIDRFSDMLHFLTQDSMQFDPRSEAALIARFASFSSSSQIFPELVPSPHPPRHSTDPFFELRTYVESTHADSKRDMLHFMGRYERAGGYMPTKVEKLCAMLRTEEVRQTKAQEQKT